MILKILAKVWERHRPFLIVGAVAIATLWVVPAIATAATAPIAPNVPLPQVNIGVGQAKNPHDVAGALQILLLLTVLTLAPTLLVLVTSFTRVIVVLSFVRTALGTQQVPPNQVLVGLALFLTFFIMAPVIKDVNQNAVQPYMNNHITQNVALDRAAQPLRKFMF
ncbi:MAG: EscR/YscR/HrcR family type III secretion system export apparatus protein, partial [Candidatus Eremiobacteraeota bacterium]|nr:EscR/YscR/HrcR family type III secretion system export apparatus protein [Candidatus Eremiobacteraeota bacterium]